VAEIRQATLLDVEAMIALGARMHDESPRFRKFDYRPQKLRALAERVIPAGGAFVAEVSGRIVGMFVGFIAEQYFGNARYASDLLVYVAPEHRGGSAFPRLFKAWESWARSQDVDEICLGIGTEVTAERTMVLYERLGYRRAGYLMVRP